MNGEEFDFSKQTLYFILAHQLFYMFFTITAFWLIIHKLKIAEIGLDRPS